MAAEEPAAMTGVNTPLLAEPQGWARVAPGGNRGHRAAAPDREARAPVASAIAQTRAPLSTGVRGAFASGVGVAAAPLVIKGLRRHGVIVAFRQRDTSHNHET